MLTTEPTRPVRVLLVFSLMAAAVPLLAGCEDKEVRQQMDTEIKNLTAEKAELARQLDEKSEEIIELKEKSNDLARRLRAEILTSSTDARSRAEVIEQLRRLVATLKARAALLDQEVEAQLKQNDAELLALRKSLLQIPDNSDVPGASIDMQQLVREIDGLSAQRDAMQQQVGVLNDSVQRLTSLNRQLEGEIRRLSSGGGTTTRPDLFDEIGPPTTQPAARTPS